MGTINIIKRKLKIQDTVNEIEDLETLIFEALISRGALSRQQRAKVLKNVVDRWKQISEKHLEEASANFVDAEKTNDILKFISL